MVGYLSDNEAFARNLEQLKVRYCSHTGLFFMRGEGRGHWDNFGGGGRGGGGGKDFRVNP